jgi:hypothetical protein
MVDLPLYLLCETARRAAPDCIDVLERSSAGHGLRHAGQVVRPKHDAGQIVAKYGLVKAPEKEKTGPIEAAAPRVVFVQVES